MQAGGSFDNQTVQKFVVHLLKIELSWLSIIETIPPGS